MSGESLKKQANFLCPRDPFSYVAQYEVYFVLLLLLFLPVTSYKSYHKVTDILNPHPFFIVNLTTACCQSHCCTPS